MKTTRTGSALVWILVGISIFALILAPVLQAGSTSRKAMWTRQRALERMVEAHRLARWACGQPEADLLALPAQLGADLPAPWDEKVRAQLATADGPASAALDGARVTLAVEADAGGRRHLHRLLLRLTAPDKTAVVVARTVLR